MKQAALLAAILATAPALAQAATVQAVFTGVADYKITQYRGSCDTCENIRNDTVIEEGYSGTPGKITVVWDTDLAEIDASSTDLPDGSRVENLRLDNAMTSIEVMSGSDILWSWSNPGGLYDAVNGGDNFVFASRSFWPDDSGNAEGYQLSANSPRIAVPGDETTERYNGLGAGFYAYRLFSPFDLKTPFTVQPQDGEGISPQMNFQQDDITRFYDGEPVLENYLGYQQETTGYLWWVDSLTVTLLDEPPAPAPIPLPAGAPLVLTGLAAFIGLRRLKRRA